MAVLDTVLELFGTNRIRMQWKVRSWQRSWERLKARVSNRSQTLTYENQSWSDRARKVGTLLWPADAPVVSTLLCASIAVVYVVTVLWSRRMGLGGANAAPTMFAFKRFGDLAVWNVHDGQWWRLSTCTFLHADLLHLAFNAISLWSVASYLEDTLGKAKTIALYLALGVVASLVSFSWHASDLAYSSVGASGAICGLIGVAIGFSLRRRNVARHLLGRYVGWAAWIGVIALSGWRIDNAAHVGGLVAGLAAGLVVRRARQTAPLARTLWRAAAAVAIAGTIACLVIAARTPLSDDELQLAAELRDAATGG